MLGKMSNITPRIALQQSRFKLIQQAADYDFDDEQLSSRQFINTRLEVLESNWFKFQEEHESICHSTYNDLHEHSYMKTKVYERCQEFYVHARSRLLTQRDDVEAPASHSRSLLSDPGAPVTVTHRSTLPRISLPTFSGNYETWRSFRDLFTAIIRDNAGLSSVEKMHYLKTSLTGEASRLVVNLPVSGDNFEIAWETLISRYENKRFLVNAELDKITHLKPLKIKSSESLGSFLTTISESLGALRALGCPVHHWDPLLLHILVKLLDSDTREAWELSLGSTMTIPTFVQFENFLVGRTRALENLARSSTSNKERASSSIVSYRSRIAAHTSTEACPLCKDSHYVANCPRYQAKTTQQRRNFVFANRRCFNCLRSHKAQQCKSNRRCLKCGQAHHTSLHISKENSTSESRKVELETSKISQPKEKEQSTPTTE